MVLSLNKPRERHTETKYSLSIASDVLYISCCIKRDALQRAKAYQLAVVWLQEKDSSRLHGQHVTAVAFQQPVTWPDDSCTIP